MRPDQIHKRASKSTNRQPASDSLGIHFQRAKPVKRASFSSVLIDGPQGCRNQFTDSENLFTDSENLFFAL